MAPNPPYSQTSDLFRPSLVRLQGNNAASLVVFSEGVLADASAADAQAFSSDGGRLTIAGTNSTLSAADGPALYLESVELTQNATFASLSSTSSNARGISIASPVGSNDVSVSGTTTISSPTTEAIRINAQAQGSTHIICAMMPIVPAAAKAAKAREWPTVPIRRGARQRIQRDDAPQTQLQQEHRGKERGERDQQGHGACLR